MNELKEIVERLDGYGDTPYEVENARLDGGIWHLQVRRQEAKNESDE